MSQSSTALVREPPFELCWRSAAFACVDMNPGGRAATSFNQGAKAEPPRNAVGAKTWQRFCLYLVAFFFSLAQAHAQSLDPTRRISQYGHTAWRTEDMTLSTILSITQTADGYIWIANRSAIVRFDGVRFVPWTPPKGTTFPGNFTFLLGSRDGSLWIGTRYGLTRFKDGQLSIYKTGPNDQAGISVISEDHAGTIWVTRYRKPKQEGALCAVVGQGLHCYGPADGVPAANAEGLNEYGLGLTEDHTGNLWFAGHDLYSWKRGARANPHFGSTKHPQILDVAVDQSGDVWAAMDDVGPQFGLRYFHNGSWGEYSTAGFHSSTVRSGALLVDKAGAVWIATARDGLYRIWKGNVDHFSKSDGLSGYSVDFLYEDHEGNLWVSTEAGVDQFRNTAITSYSIDEGLTSNSVPSVLASRDGTVWAGSYDGSAPNLVPEPANVLRPGPNRAFSPGPKIPGRIAAMFESRSGTLWFLVNDVLASYAHEKVNSVLTLDGHIFHDNYLTAISEEDAHTILTLDNTSLLRIRDQHMVEAIPLPKPLSSGGFLASNRNGGAWIVGQRQADVMLYEHGIIRSYPPPSNETSLKVNAILADPDDPLLLITSNKGLFRWDGKGWSVLDETNGLPCNQTLEGIKDHQGSLWLQADCGLLKIEATDLKRWRQNPTSRLSVTVFDLLDGAQTGSSHQYQPTMSVAPDGKVWYTNGLLVQMIDPDQVYRNPLPPLVHVEQIVADGTPYQFAGIPHLAPNPRNLEIDYTALSLSVPHKVQFRYLLEGHDKDWQGPVTRRQAFYTDLPPGNYRFHVVACNNSGVWNDIGAIAAFNVEPTFYQTLWFKALIAIAVFGVLWALYLLRLKQATAHVQERLFAQMEERERIARELHDTLLQGFQGITLRMQGVSKNLPVEDPPRKMMEEVLDRADEVLREARQRVRNLRRRATDENELPDRLTKCGQELAEDHTATFTLAIVGEPRVLESTVQDEAYRIIVESLTNAFRHASASKIEVEVTYDSSALRIRVRDDGVGIDKALLSSGQPGHWGLTGMRERARALRAELNIWTRGAAGTEVELVVPASIAYPREETRAS